jgi:hypothetical protein
MTSKDMKEYIDNPDHCPYCDGRDLFYDTAIYGRSRQVQCFTCEKSWLEVMQVMHIITTDSNQLQETL